MGGATVYIISINIYQIKMFTVQRDNGWDFMGGFKRNGLYQ